MAYTFTKDPYGGPPHLRFDTPTDFVHYVRDVQAGKYPGITADPGSIRQAESILKDPKQWGMESGHPKFLGGWLDRNLKWVIPAAAGGAMFGLAAPAIFGGGGGAAAASGGSGAAGTAGAAGSAGAAGTGAASAGSMIGQTVGSSAMNPAIQAALSLLSGIPALVAGRSNPTAEEQALQQQAQRLLALQEQRITHQNPLFEAATRLAMSRLPTAQQRPLTDLPTGG